MLAPAPFAGPIRGNIVNGAVVPVVFSFYSGDAGLAEVREGWEFAYISGTTPEVPREGVAGTINGRAALVVSVTRSPRNKGIMVARFRFTD